MFVAGNHHLIVFYLDVSGGFWCTEEADGVEGHLKLRASTNKCGSHRFHLQGGKGACGCMYLQS